MTKSKLLTGMALAGLLLSTSALSPVGPLAVTPAQAQSVSVSFDLFFEELEPHGVWVSHPQYRYVFCPTGVDTTWRPYTNGRWLYLEDHGWYFASDEPFAWATYHYGRWLDDDNLGWCWVPGTKWAPAWVSWRRGDEVVGWAPLPPEGEGYAVSLEVVREDFPEDYWVFVPTRSFIEPDLSVNIIFGADARDYYTDTEFLGPVVVEGDVVTNNVIEVTYIEQQINQEITVYNVEEAPDPTAVSVTGDQTVQIFNQEVAEPTEDAAPAEAVDEAEAPAVIAEEGGTAGAEESEATEPAAEGETPEADAVTTEETAEPETEATEPAATEPEGTESETTETEATEPAASETEATETDADAAAPEAATDAEAEATTEEAEPEAGAEQPATEEEPAADQPAPAAEEQTEETTQPAEAEVEAETQPADAEVEANEEAASPAEEAAPPAEEAPAADCPPELLVDGVCQPAEQSPAEPEAAQPDEASEAPVDAETVVQ